MRNGQVVYGRVKVQAGVALAGIQRPRERNGQFADKAVIRDAEVTKLESEADEVSDKVGSVNTAVNKDGAVDIGVGGG